jgi:bifunctional non-homologous end joining protein LigD
MRRTFDFCLAVPGKRVPSGPDWLHEIKYDGYRMMLVREGSDARLFTMNGHDWTQRYPLIVQAALQRRQKQFVLDGEVVVLDARGVSDFDGLHSRKRDGEPQLHAFDCPALGSDDLRKLPLHMRKANLAQLVDRRPDGIFLAPFEASEIGPDLFRAACDMGLEGLVSKHRERPYRPGRCDHWIRMKNREYRVQECKSQ